MRMKPKYTFTNILGTFYFNEHFDIINSKMFKNLVSSFKKDSKELDKGEQIKKILKALKKREFYKLFYERNMIFSKERIKNSVKADTMIAHAINNILDIEQVTNTLVKDLREWYELYNPELSREVQEHERFVEIITIKNKEDLLKGIGLTNEDSLGTDLQEKDLTPMKSLASSIKQLYELKVHQENYLESLMKEFCPNLNAVAMTIIGAKFIRHAGSLKSLMVMPSSKIQLLGAEKALFRHMKSGAKPPKYGIIFQHPLIQKAEKKMQGKIARALADKISIAVKVDYFRGEFIGDMLYKDVEKKLHNLQ